MDWRNEYLNYLESSERSELTVKAYFRDLVLYARWFKQVAERRFEPGVFCAPDVREYRSYILKEEKKSPGTWNRYLASLRVFAEWAIDEGYIEGDPLLGVKFQDEVKLPPYWLTEKEFRDFRRQLDININLATTETWKVQAIRDRAMCALMLYRGLRVGEVVKVSPEDLLLKSRSGWVTIRDGKGDVSAKQALGSEVRLALRAWLDVRPEGEWLFPGKGTERISTRQVERRVNAIAELAGVEDMHAHRLRHTFIRRLAVKKDGSPRYPRKWVQDEARHKRASTTERYYQASRDDIQAMVEDM